MPEPIPDPEIMALETALAGLKPQAPSMDRDQLMFRAGRSSVPTRVRIWQGTTGIMATVALGLGLAVVSLIRREPLVVEKVVTVTVKEPPTFSPPKPIPPVPATPDDLPAHVAEENLNPAGGLLRMRNQVLAWGVDVLPNPPPATAALPTVSLRELLDFPPESLDKISTLRFKNSFTQGEHS